MKVLFIYTDIGISVGYSCGIGVLSGYLKDHGHETRLLHISDELDYGLDVERIVNDITADPPGLIAFSAVTNQWFYVRTIAKFIRRACPIPIIVGGHHANAAYKEIIREPAVDYVCKGEGERPLLELVNRLATGRRTDDIPNILTKRRAAQPVMALASVGAGASVGLAEAVAGASAIPADGGSLSLVSGTCGSGGGTGFLLDDGTEVVDNPVGRWVDDLDSLPFEDREVFDYGRIVQSRYGWAEVIASRGCPYACTYCFNIPFFDMYKVDLADTPDQVKLRDFVRRRSVESTIAMLRSVKENYPGVRAFTFVDDVFAIYSRWLADLAGPYKREIGLPFAATSQPLAFNEQIAALLKDMGCKVVKMGVEAGNPDIRNQVLNRNISDQVLINAFEIARRYGLKPQAFNMIGLPRETRENMLETVRLNARLRSYIVWVSTFMPYPGTELLDFCVANDLIDTAKWDEIRSYRGGSVLKEKTFTRLELEQIRVMFRWHLNAALDNECSATYQKNIDELSALGEDAWLDGTAEALWKEREPELDERFRQQGVDHYVGKKYVNIFWAKEYDYDLS